jgi:uncharacterized protein YndB with AHSA1/START domain
MGQSAGLGTADPRAARLAAQQPLAYDPEFLTEVELTFAPAAGGGSIVTVKHRNFERYGYDAEKIAGLLGGGWPTCLGEFAAYADAHSSMEEAS